MIGEFLLYITSTAGIILSSNKGNLAKTKTKEATTENDDGSHNKVACKEKDSSTAGSHEANHATSTTGSAFEKGKEGLSDVRRDKLSSARLTAVVYKKQKADLSGTKQATIRSADNLSTTQDGETSPNERMATDGTKISADSPTNSCLSVQDWKTGSVGKTSCADEKQDASVAELKETGSISAASYPSALEKKISPIKFLANADTKELSSGSVETGKPLLSSQEAFSGEKSTFDFTTFNKNETMALIDKGIKGFDEEPFDADAQMEILSSGNSANFLKVL